MNGLAASGSRPALPSGQGRVAVWAPALSFALHAAALAALLLWLDRTLPPAPEEAALAMVFEPAAEDALAAPEEGMTPEAPPPPAEVAAPPAPPEAAPPPPPPSQAAPPPVPEPPSPRMAALPPPPEAAPAPP
ncbi:hypothetical protein JYK14_04765, partial [Siccirubricoccus sp. KC 17139]